MQEDLNDIKRTIDDEYNKLYDQIKTKSICSSSLKVLNKVIEILEDVNETKNSNVQKIQMQINQVLDEHPEKLLFNKDKLREIPFSSTPVSEMLLSLNAIKQNPKFRNPLLNEQPKSSVLYSPAVTNPSYSKSLANVLIGNCFFITLYGNKLCTNRVLSSLTDNEIEEHNAKDVITIYGPVDFVSFGKTVSLSLEMLKRFNGNFPNLYFIEVSNEYEDKMMKEWCEFISYISHFLIFCSHTIPTQKEINKFNDSLLLKFFNGKLINCSPFSKESISFGDSDHEIKDYMNINIDFLLDNLLLTKLFAEIYEIRLNFIPCETIATLSFIVLEKKVKNIMQRGEKEKFKQDIIRNYSTQMHNKAIQYFHNEINKIINEIYENIEVKKYDNDFHLNDALEFLLEKTQQYLYTNIYVEFWDDKDIEMVSNVLKAEIKNDFESQAVAIKQIEAIEKLLTFLKSQNYQKSLSEVKSLLTFLEKVDPAFNPKKIPKSQIEIQDLTLKTEQIHNNIVSTIKENQNLMKAVDSFSNKLYSFLDENPVVSDKEYSIYYNELYELNNASKNSNIEKYINITLNIRKVLDDYKLKKFTVEIDKNSFGQGGIKLQTNSMEFVLKSAMTCHEFFNYVRKSFDLENVPFHITRMSNDQFNKPISIEVLDDQTNLLLLNSYNFTVRYGVCVYSTQVLIKSLIPQKTIKISDDFIIETNSKDAKFAVDFPSDHKGWFNVEWDIKNISTMKYKTDFTLIYLTMTAEEISFLQEGNLLYHQSYHDGQWIDEYDPIFVLFPECQKIVFPLRHCSFHRIFARFIRIFGFGFLRRPSTLSEMESSIVKKAKSSTPKKESSSKKEPAAKKVETSSSKKEPSTKTGDESISKKETSTKKVDTSSTKKEPSTKTGDESTSKKEASTKKVDASKKDEASIKKEELTEEQRKLLDLFNYNYSRDWEHEDGDIEYMRGGVSYYLPVGYKSDGIKIDKFKENTCVGFHATKATVLFKIIQEGFKLPSELPGKGVNDNHIELGVTVFGIKNYANAIFVSPSIVYSALYGGEDDKIIARTNICTYVHVGHIEQNQILIIILQTRVTPKSYTVHKNTTPYKVFDHHYSEDVVEWRILNKKDVFPYRILYKTVSLVDYLVSYVE